MGKLKLEEVKAIGRVRYRAKQGAWGNAILWTALGVFVLGLFLIIVPVCDASDPYPAKYTTQGGDVILITQRSYATFNGELMEKAEESLFSSLQVGLLAGGAPWP